ncbi:aldo/keto reductase, partial [Mesorhizobium sp. M0659]
MQSRKFGRTGRSVSEIGFGAWAIGAAWGEVNDDDAVAAL